MTYITFTTYPDVPQRQYRGVILDSATSKYTAEVDEVLSGEATVTLAEYDAALTAARAAYVPPGPPAPVTRPPSPLALTLAAFAASPALDLVTKALLAAIKAP